MDIKALQSADEEAIYSIHDIDQDWHLARWFAVLSLSPLISFWKAASAKEYQLIII